MAENGISTYFSMLGLDIGKVKEVKLSFLRIRKTRNFECIVIDIEINSSLKLTHPRFTFNYNSNLPLTRTISSALIATHPSI